jgi:hypothetical protein
MHAERTHALLLASSLPCFLWKEAMKHSAWLQDCTPARALNSKTPYEMGHSKKLHLARIQKFRAAAYVKDLTARNWMPEQRKVISSAMIPNPKAIKFIGLRRD